jgi:phenylpropionate dioxygenase-like ring-hydroxylating dioxygenase large terminal subunit
MLSKTDNEMVSRVGPGTVMGSLFRQYWVPAVLSRELPSPGSDPVRVLLLGEKLIAFRDTHGQVGLIQNHCPHRGASLFFGRNEELDPGLRCVYHGWKFAIDGTCIDMPNEPAESDFKSKVNAVAYPTRERGGIVWAYLGPRQTPPPLPDLEANMLPEGVGEVDAVQRRCNWLQALEGDIDTAHLGFLHMGLADANAMTPGTFGYYTIKDRAPRYAVVDTPGGSMYGAYRPAEPGITYWRIAHYLLPCHVLIPTGALGRQVLLRSWVPMDDEHVMFFNIGAPGTTRSMDFSQVPPNTTGWYGRFRVDWNASNDWGLDRQQQRGRHSYTGLPNVHIEDQAITESMGTLLDRSQEHLGSSDAMIIRTRRRLLAAATALAEHGTIPPGADDPTVYRVRAGSIFLAEGADWIEATTHLREAFADHPDLDPNPRLPVPAGRGGGSNPNP